MISTKDAPLEVSPKALNGISGDVTISVFLRSVTDDIVDISFLRKTLVSRHLIGEDTAVISNELLDNRHQGNGLGVFHLHGTDITLTDHHTEDGSLGLGAAALGILRFLGFVLVGLTATKVHLIHFHLAFKDGSIVLMVESTDLMENIPSGLLRDVDITAQLRRGNTLLVRRDEIHRNEPLAEGYLGVFKDGSHKDGEVRLAVTAMETTIGTAYAMVLTAERTYDILLVPTGFKDGLAAFLLGREVIGQFEDRVESSEINHKAQVSRLLYYLYLNLGLFLQKV